MDIFEYLPQLIVAYDGNDEFANLIHIKKAEKDKNYYCPCCGGIVKPRAIDSTREQSHYYHTTGKCTKESQLHFFCKNWLFEKGSKFYIENNLFEVASIDIEQIHKTQFGDYKPDVTVNTTSGKTIYFEMFFSNRKTGDDYFCKWDNLGNDVVEINIKEYMYKTDEDVIPRFKYLYHDGICYSKKYEKGDLYANTIAKIKQELTRQKILDYKVRIERLDWFWQKVRSNESKESILEVITTMNYEDMVSCYEIIKRKQCVSYLKNDVLNLINQKVVSDVRKSLDLPTDENVYFDLKHYRGRTYEAGIRLNIKTEHIIYDNFYVCCDENRLNCLNGYPKIVFSKNIFNLSEIVIPKNKLKKLKQDFEETVEFKGKLTEYEKALFDLEGNDYKIRVKNNVYTVLARIHNDNFEIVFDHFHMGELNIEKLKKEIQYKIREIRAKEHIDIILNNKEYCSMMSVLKNYKNMDCQVNIEYERDNFQLEKSGIHLKLYVHSKCIYNELLATDLNNFTQAINSCKQKLDDYAAVYDIAIKLVDKINNCSNNFWKAQFSFDYKGCPEIEIDQKFIQQNMWNTTYEKIKLHDFELLREKDIISMIEEKMRLIMGNMEEFGYRVMEVID